MLRREQLWQIDWLLVAIVAAIVVIGALFVWSAAYRPGPGGQGYYLDAAGKQFLWIGVGVAACAATLLVDYRKILKYADLFYLLGMAVLLPMVFDVKTYRDRWFNLGVVMVQPSEFVKIALILTLAKYLPDREHLQRWSGWWVPGVLTLCPMVLLAQQPDLGAALVLVPVLAAMLFAAGARRRHFIVLGGVAAAAVAAIIFAAFVNPPVLGRLLQDYQKQRIVNFFRQDRADPEARLRELYQITQSKIAIGSGGLFGRGWGQGTQNRLDFLPYRTSHTDFIMAVIAEEAGFLGTAVLLLLFFVFFVGCLGIADRASDPQGRAIVVGVAALLAAAVFINAGSATGLLPTKGMTMPFVSYGGSSTAASFIALGLVLNVGLRRSAYLAGGDRAELAPLRKILK